MIVHVSPPLADVGSREKRPIWAEVKEGDFWVAREKADFGGGQETGFWGGERKGRFRWRPRDGVLRWREERPISAEGKSAIFWVAREKANGGPRFSFLSIPGQFMATPFGCGREERGPIRRARLQLMKTPRHPRPDGPVQDGTGWYHPGRDYVHDCKTELGSTKTEPGLTKTEPGSTKTELGSTKTEPPSRALYIETEPRTRKPN